MAQVAAAQSQIGYSDRRITATVDYTRPLLFSASLQPEVRRGLQQLVADSAAAQVNGMVQQRARAAQVSVLPWHRDRRRAKAALVRYLDGRVTYLRAIGRDSNLLYMDHPELLALFEQTYNAFQTAGGTGQRHRIAVAFAGGTHPA
jgi:hypothetical protein